MWGTGLYIKSCYEFELMEKLSKSIKNVSESLFVEIKREKAKNLILGCVYRQHTPISTFVSEYLKNALNSINSKPNKMCILMGDFNMDLLKCSIKTPSRDFYDLCSFSFIPQFTSLKGYSKNCNSY